MHTLRLAVLSFTMCKLLSISVLLQHNQCLLQPHVTLKLTSNLFECIQGIKFNKQFSLFNLPLFTERRTIIEVAFPSPTLTHTRERVCILFSGKYNLYI